MLTGLPRWILGEQQHTHTRLTALFLGLPRWATTRKVKPIWILLKQVTVSGSGISWTICKSAPCSRQATTPALHHSGLQAQSRTWGSSKKGENGKRVETVGVRNGSRPCLAESRCPWHWCCCFGREDRHSVGEKSQCIGHSGLRLESWACVEATLSELCAAFNFDFIIIIINFDFILYYNLLLCCIQLEMHVRLMCH